MRWHCPSVCLSVRLSVRPSIRLYVGKMRTLKRDFLKNKAVIELWSLLMTHKKSYMGFSKPVIRPLKSKTAEIRHLQNGDDFIFLLCAVRLG